MGLQVTIALHEIVTKDLYLRSDFTALTDGHLIEHVWLKGMPWPLSRFGNSLCCDANDWGNNWVTLRPWLEANDIEYVRA